MPLARRSISKRSAPDQLECRLEAVIASAVDAGRGEDLEALPVGTHGRMQADPARVGVRQVGLSIRAAAEPTAQPAHSGAARTLYYGKCGHHCLGRPARVLQQRRAVPQALLGGTRRYWPGRTNQLNRTAQLEDG